VKSALKKTRRKRLNATFKRIGFTLREVNVRHLGFTLIELLIIIAILGILAGLVFVAVNPAKRSNQAKVSGALRFAKQVDYSLTFETVGQWNFDDSSNPSQALDTSGNNHGTIIGATYDCNDTPYHIVGSGNGKCALSFDGVDDSVTIPYNSTINPKNAITVTAWVKPDKQHTNQAHIVTMNGAYSLRIDNRVRALVCTSGSWQNSASGIANSIKSGKWYHIAMTYDSTSRTILVYLDGAQDGSYTLSGLASYTICTSNQELFFEGGWDEKYKGLIDDVRIYASTLTTMEIQQMYAQTAPKYQTSLLGGESIPNLVWNTLTSKENYLFPL
jgi:prepilin-type N-terminal cleavage/methylation domain-containing protein